MRIFISQLLGRLTRKLEFEAGSAKATYKHRLLLMMDEFTALGKIVIEDRVIAYMAGYGIKGYFIVQDLGQLAEVYGQNNAIMSNCHICIAHAPNTPEAAAYLCKLA